MYATYLCLCDLLVTLHDVPVHCIHPSFRFGKPKINVVVFFC